MWFKVLHQLSMSNRIVILFMCRSLFYCFCEWIYKLIVHELWFLSNRKKGATMSKLERLNIQYSQLPNGSATLNVFAALCRLECEDIHSGLPKREWPRENVEWGDFTVIPIQMEFQCFEYKLSRSRNIYILNSGKSWRNTLYKIYILGSTEIPSDGITGNESYFRRYPFCQGYPNSLEVLNWRVFFGLVVPFFAGRRRCCSRTATSSGAPWSNTGTKSPASIPASIRARTCRFTATSTGTRGAVLNACASGSRMHCWCFCPYSCT